ncbi:MAG: spiro-SPASM protein [Spirochaetales bacterium]|nr:spiro-SPASM protein [Spirochaetales bacterium]
MNNIVIINASGLSEYAMKDMGNGRNSVEFAVEAALKMPATGRAVIIDELCPCLEYLSSFTKKTRAKASASALIQALIELSEGYDNIFYFYADCPLIDTDLAGKMYRNHLKYFSEYTFADGYPVGLTVEIIKTSVLPLVAKLAENDDSVAGRNTVFSLIEKDINSFDIETEISPDDQRLLRLSLFPDTKRNFLQLKAIMKVIKDGNGLQPEQSLSGEVLNAVRKRGEFLRTLPVFIEIETSSSRPQRISYMPEAAASEGEMAVEDFKAVLSKISDFSGDAVISLSVRNEPSSHSSPAALAGAVLDHPDFSLLIETSGIGWTEEQLNLILGLDSSRLTWIVDLDALDRGLYSSLRGDGLDEAYRFASSMVEKSPGNVWLQAVRMKDNETDMEQFYKYWKERTKNVIIQKYDWCCGRLPQRKVTNLSPVKRLPCWHLKREMIVLPDGRVPVCRDDLDNEMVLGNIFSDDIESLWQNGTNYYKQHLNEEYPDLCRNCDEYYTYNY